MSRASSAIFDAGVAVRSEAWSPRAWAQEAWDVRRWTEMPRGGHFAALEVPDLLVPDVCAFYRELPVAATPGGRP